jgi:hypothetical protein
LEKRRINLWSSPRNISTAMMYSFGNRPDTTVVDEPLYAYFLSAHKDRPPHPGEAEILGSQIQDGRAVIKKVLLREYASPIVLFKQMTHHLVGLSYDFVTKMDNVLLIRHPEEIIHSYSKVIPNPSMDDVGIAMQVELYDFLQQKGKAPIILDTNEVLKNPEKILTELCVKLDIPFDKAMLSWQAGSRKEDGIWAQYWYQNVHRSTGFKPYEKREIQLSDELSALAKEAMPYYESLFQKAVKA